MNNKTYLCKCNNCDNVLIDENPATDAVKQELTGNELAMVQIYEPTNPDEVDDEIYWGCPKCETDEFLMDL